MKKYSVLGVLILIFLALKFYIISKPFGLSWDEAAYIGIGKYLFSLGRSGIFENIRPPLLPLLLGFFWKIGLSPLICGKIAEIIFSALLLLAVYLVASEIFDHERGIISVAVLMASPLFLYHSDLIYTGIPSTFFALFAVFVFVKGRFWLSGFFTGIAFMTRFPQGLMIGVFFCALVSQGILEKDILSAFKRFLKVFLAFLFTISPFLIFNLLMYRGQAGGALEAVLFPFKCARFVERQVPLGGGGGFFSNLAFYSRYIFKEEWVLVFSVFGGMALFSRRNLFDPKRRLILLYAVFYLFYFLSILARVPRFFIVMLPVFSILAAYGLWIMLRCFFVYARKINPAVKALLVSVFLSLLFFGRSFIVKESKVSEPPVSVESMLLNGVYEYLDKFPVKGAILTSLPLPAAQNDRLYVPMYSCEDNYWYRCYEEKARINNAEVFIFYPDTFECWNNDQNCQAGTSEFFNVLSSKKVLYKKELYGKSIYLLSAR